MERQEVMAEASAIARGAYAKARDAEIERTVREFERSDVRCLKSLARLYRLTQGFGR
jgi:hypothetical protein